MMKYEAKFPPSFTAASDITWNMLCFLWKQQKIQIINFLVKSIIGTIFYAPSTVVDIIKT